MAYQRKDRFYRRAKDSGYRSRAAYKLLELARRHRLIRSGDRVVDLGAWPGGWMQVAAELAGRSGRVVGVDLVRITPFAEPNILCVEGDVRLPSVQNEIVRHCAGEVDVVLSDMAPKLSGVRARDEARGYDLALTALQVARRMLRPGGRFLLKVFTGPESDDLFSAMRGAFREVRRTRPEATRAGSSEMYFVGLHFVPQETRSQVE